MTGLQSLIDQKWPPLSAQKLAIYYADDAEDLDWDIHALASAQWPKLAVLDLSSLYLRAYDIQILASAHLPSLTAVNLAGNELIEDAIKELVKASWPRLERLNLSWQDYSYTSSGSTFAAYLVKGEWPLLKTLDISGGYVCIGHLLNGKWPALEDPILLDMFHDEDAPTIVKDTSGLAWPNLRRRSLSGGAVDKLGIAELTLAEWPCLESVCLDGVSAENVAQVFTSCAWPALSHLELRHSNAAALADLVETATVILRHIRFFCYPIRLACAAQLVQANWCNLHYLGISCCALNFEAVSELSRGLWPLLHSLVVCETPLFWPTDSVKRLLDGRWQTYAVPSDCEAAAFLLSGSTEAS